MNFTAAIIQLKALWHLASQTSLSRRQARYEEAARLHSWGVSIQQNADAGRG